MRSSQGRTHHGCHPVTLGQSSADTPAIVRLGVRRVSKPLCRRVARTAAGRNRGEHRDQHPLPASRKPSFRPARTGGLPFTGTPTTSRAQGGQDSLTWSFPGQLLSIAVSLITDQRPAWMASGTDHGSGGDPSRPAARLQHRRAGSAGPAGMPSWSAHGSVGNGDRGVLESAAELNVMMPVMTCNLLESIRLLSLGSALLLAIAASTASEPMSSASCGTRKSRPRWSPAATNTSG